MLILTFNNDMNLFLAGQLIPWNFSFAGNNLVCLWVRGAFLLYMSCKTLLPIHLTFIAK